MCYESLMSFEKFVLLTTLAGFGKQPHERSLPNSARRRTAGSLVRGLCPIRPAAYWWQPRERAYPILPVAYWWQPRKEDFPDFGQGVLSGCLARRTFTVFGRGVLIVASRGGLIMGIV